MATRRRGIEKVTVSLPGALVEYADERAAALHTSRRQVISEALAEYRTRLRDDLAREGYAFYADESREFATSSTPAVSEALHDAS
jgi:metal-responsive CopG/Arc/MetJ family transcriptional regulator